MRKLRSIALLAVWMAAGSTDPAAAARYKLNLIQSGKARPRSVIYFSEAELNAYVRSELPSVAPEGVRDTHLELAPGIATGSARIDFLKLRYAQGANTPWLIARLIEGEKFVKVRARIQSARGQATVYLQRVELSGLAVSGTTLDFLIQTFLLPLYPDAKINQPFALTRGVDHIEVGAGAARVVMRP